MARVYLLCREAAHFGGSFNWKSSQEATPVKVSRQEFLGGLTCCAEQKGPTVEVMALVTGTLSNSGVSIQYQSSRLAEFIMVKDADLPQALENFTERGCKQSFSSAVANDFRLMKVLHRDPCK